SFLATGRSPNSEIVKDIKEIEIDKRGAIITNKMMKTNKNNIYAAGDVTGGINLTTVARMEGITAARNMAGYSNIIDYKTIPQGIGLGLNISFAENNPSNENNENNKNNDNNENNKNNDNNENNKNNDNNGDNGDNGELNEIIYPGSGGPGSFWKILTKDTGISKIKFNPKTKEIKWAGAISPSSINDVAYISYLLRTNQDMEDYQEEFIEIHPSTDLFHDLITEIYKYEY
ncbi:MAG: FAD-dependent oxidoreductase, partial [Methanobrevibacter sp.]|nr:FAD-dependent oxidoreductase [Methanobrevibacter sp.]